VAAALAALTVFLFLTGGGQIDVAGLTVSSRDWRRPAALLAALLAARALFLWQRRGPQLRARIEGDVALIGFGAICALLPALTLRFLDLACGGLDSHGYVSAARLIASGRLSVPQPIAEWLPVDNAIDALTPLGYVPSLDGRDIVPMYPPGLPLVMALFRAVLGADGPFFVAPVLGATTIALSYGVVSALGGRLAGGLSAAAIAAHPVFFTYSLQAMSDVPATFWVVLAGFCLTRNRAWPAWAGAAAGMAMLTRPPLALAAAVFACIVFVERRAASVRFVAGFAPFVAALILLNMLLYGSPALSGYGSPGDLFSANVIPRNLQVYSRWMLNVHTPVLVVMLAAAWFVCNRRAVAAALLLFAAVAAPYMAYVPSFDDWEMLRFLLPGVVFLIMISACALARILERLAPAPAAALLAVTVAAAVTAGWYQYVQNRQVFQLWIADSKYPEVARWISRNSDDNALVFASLHSGSVRYYSGRTTIRWDRIPAGQLSQAVAAIAGRGHRMFLVLDGNDERQEFASRFDDAALAGVRIEFVDRHVNAYLATVAPR
jgi:hypothetical protein